MQRAYSKFSIWILVQEVLTKNGPPVNISSEATQGNAVESNYASQEFGSWGDLAGSPWLYNLFKKEKCTDGRIDPRLYWTLVTYEDEYNSDTGVKTRHIRMEIRVTTRYTKQISRRLL